MASASGSNANMQQAARARKRSRYAPHACQRCQKAKVRCDGRLPCVYCSSREGDCQYSVQAQPSFQAHVPQSEDEPSGLRELSALLREQSAKLDLLIEKTAQREAAYEARAKSDTSIAVSVLPPQKQALPLFQTSTSAFFCVNVVDAGVRKLRRGYSPDQPFPLEAPRAQTRSALSIIQGEVVHGEPSDISRSELEDDSDAVWGNSIRHQDVSIREAGASLLDEVDHDRLLQAVQNFATLEYPMYPILDMDHVMQQARYFSGTAIATLSRRENHLAEMRNVSKDDLAILKMVVAIGLLAEGDLCQKFAMRLFETVRPDVENMIWSAAVDLKDLILMTLVILFHLHRGRWRIAWRFQGNVSRIILELGLNRRMILDRSFADIKARVHAINTIWTVFVLEQHLSYALGFSNAMPNLRLESDFPQPVDAPFLTLMIDYASIGRQSCDALLSDKVLRPENLSSWQDDYAYFQYRVSLWSTRASESLTTEGDNLGITMVQTILRLRANHLRTLVARAFLASGLREVAPLDIWTVVDIASETIQTLIKLDAARKEHRFHQAQFNHFLVAALDILLFATTHKFSGVGSPSANGEVLSIPSETAQKAQEMSMVALDHLRSLAGWSSQSRYLWDRVRAMTVRLNISENLSPATGKGETVFPMQTASTPPSFAEVSASVGLAIDQLAPLNDLDPSQFNMPFTPDDATAWAFQGVCSSGFDFDLTGDLSTLLNNSC